MTDRDNITLPREVVFRAVKALTPMAYETWPRERNEIVADLRTHLAAPKQEPVAWMFVNLDGECEQIEYGTPPTDDDSITPLYAAPPYAAPPEDKTHPGYVIGSHWLETAYSRICAGEDEADVLRDMGWERVDEALTATRDRQAGMLRRLDDREAELDAEIGRLREELAMAERLASGRLAMVEQLAQEVEALRRDAERYRWLRERAWFQDEFEGRYGDSGETVHELDAAIDAAMEASTAPASAAADSSTAPEAKP